MDHRKEHRRLSRLASVRSTGLIIAITVAIASAAIIGWFVVVGQSAPGPKRARGTPGPVVPAPDIRDLTPAQGGPSLTRSGQTTVQWADRDNPSRVAGQMRYDSLEPLQDKRYLMSNPRIWNFLADGRAVYVRADTGRAYIPDANNRRPESATLDGAVTIKLFDKADEAILATPDESPASVVATMAQVTYDGAIGEVSTPGTVSIDGRAWTYKGTELRLIYNESARRIDLLRLGRDHTFTYNAAADRREPEPAPQPTTPQTPAAPNASAAPATPDRTTLYTAVFSDGLTVHLQDRTVTADQLVLWARTINDRLAPGAVKEIMPDEPRPSTAAVSAVEPPPSAPPDAPANPTNAAQSPTVVLTWKGPLELKPIETWPAPYPNDHLVGRLTAESTGRVEFIEKDGPSARAGLVEYRATTQELTAVGAGPAGISLSMPGGLEFAGSRMSVNLGTLVGQIPGAGEIRAPLTQTAAISEPEPDPLNPSAPTVSTDPPAPPALSQASWGEKVEFQLARLPDRKLTLKEVFMHERVRLMQSIDESRPGLAVRGDFVRAVFTPGRDQRPQVARFVADGRVEAFDPQGGQVRADSLDIGFRMNAQGRTVPNSATAKGNATASRDGQTIAAGAISTDFAVRDGNKIDVVHARAIGGFTYTTRDGVFASGETLELDAVNRVADISSSDRVSSVGQAGTRIEAPEIRIEDRTRKLTAGGPGVFTHTDAPTDARDPKSSTGSFVRRLRVSWTEGMVYDDLAGLAECKGDVAAEGRPDAYTIERAEAGALAIRVTPAGQSTPQPNAPALAQGGGERRWLGISATAAQSRPSVAKIESRRYVEPIAADADKAQTLESLMYLEGASISADAQTGVFEVPSPGRFILSDRRNSAASELPSAPSDRGSLGQGDAMFEWYGSLRFERAAGELTITDAVRVTHRRLSDQQLSDLQADRMVARIEEIPIAGAKPDDQPRIRGKLSTVTASGRVQMVSGEYTVRADTIDYDAARSEAVATANPGAQVTVIDNATGVPRLPAAKIKITLGPTPRFDIIDPGTPVNVPR